MARSKTKQNPMLEKPMHMPMHEALIPHFGYCFTKSAMKLRAYLSDEVEKMGLALPTMGMMMIINEAGAMNQISLGEQMKIDKATMVKLLDSLEDGGYVRRKNDPNDRRVKLVELTAKGRTALPKMMKMREKCEDEFLAPLTKSEEAELRRLILKLVKAHL